MTKVQSSDKAGFEIMEIGVGKSKGKPKAAE
jgi:hypothetical protein